MKVVDKLSDTQWAKIIDTSIIASKQKKETIPAQVEEVWDSSAESDFELADDEKGGGAELDDSEYHNDSSNGMGNKEDHMDVDTHLEVSRQ